MKVREFQSNELPSGLNLGGTLSRRPQPLNLCEERVSVYDAIFGACDCVYHEQAVLTPYVEIYRYRPTARRPFFTFVTAGMSDRAMHSPPRLGVGYRRVELVFYAAEGKAEYATLLRDLAHFPHQNDTWIHWGHTQTYESPPSPEFPSGTLNCLLFMPSPVEPDSRLAEYLSWEDDPVFLLWCTPISMAEYSIRQNRGVPDLYDVVGEGSRPFIYGGYRDSCV